jgi:hypothetical protein
MVRTDQRGRPTAVSRESVRQFTEVETILDRWRIDDEWWRGEVSRMYYQVVLRSGPTVTIFQDLLSVKWFFQNAATPAESAS